MLVILKLLQSLVRTLHSEGTPAQIAAGIALGACLGLTPLFNLHNIGILAALALLNVSFGAGLLGLAVFAPVGFLLDPLFDWIGNVLLVDSEFLRPMWEAIDNAPILALFNLDNTVVVGSIVGWAVLSPLIYLAARRGVIQYRLSIGERVRQSRAYKAIRASRVYNMYSWFRE